MIYESLLLQSASPFQNAGSILMMVGMFAVMYFFMIRPQQKKQKEQRQFTEDLKKGDEVVTLGGMHGKITEIDTKTVTLEVAPRLKILFDRTAISLENTKALTEPEKTDKK